MNIHKLIKKSKRAFAKKCKLMEKHLKNSTILRLATTVFCASLIIFSMAYVAYSQDGTTIGLNISTNDLLVAGNATTTGNQVISGNLTVRGTFIINCKMNRNTS